MRAAIPLVNFVDRQKERDALIVVHKRCLAALLAVVEQHPADALLRTECVRFFDESLWAVTEIRPGLKHDTRYVSEGVRQMIESHNASPRSWRYTGPCQGWLGRTVNTTVSSHTIRCHR